MSTCQNVILVIVTGFDYSRDFSSSRGCPYIVSMSRTPKGSPGLGFHPSKSCRFCQKNLTCLGTKVPRVSLFNAVRNKELINATLSSEETLVLADVVPSLGHKLLRNEELSSVSCLTCARTLTRIYGTFKKLTGKSNAGFVTVSAKRLSSNSPTGISPSAKRTRELLAPSGTSRSPRRSLNLSSENQAPVVRVSSLEDQINSAMNLDSATGPNSGQTVMKVRLACSIII